MRTATRPCHRRSPIVAIAAAGITMMGIAAAIDGDTASEPPSTTAPMAVPEPSAVQP